MSGANRRWAPGVAVALLTVAAACSEETAPTGTPVTVSDSAGIPEYRLAALPRWDDPRFLWTLEVERSVPTGAADPLEPPLLYRPLGVTRLADGRLVVLDADEPLLAVVAAAEPSIEHRFGRRGQGPGEIWSSNAQLWPAGPESFWLFDAGNLRVSRFTTSGVLEVERPIEIGGNGGVAIVRPADHAVFVWKVFMPDPDTGELVDSIGRLDAGADRIDFVAPMAPRPEGRRRNTDPVALFAAKSWFAPVRGGVVVGRSDTGRFRHYDDDGAVVGIIDVPMEPAPIPMEHEAEILEEFLGVVRGSRPMRRPVIAERYPLYNFLLPVSDTLFALQQGTRSAPQGEEGLPDFVWRVFSTRGYYAGTVVLPQGAAMPFWIEDGRVVAIRADSLGVGAVESYRITPPRDRRDRP